MKELYDTIDKASPIIDELWRSDQQSKSELAQLWQRCAAFANGNQQTTSQNAQTAQISGSQFLVSQSQDTRQQIYTTNEIESIKRTLVSYMTRSKPAVEVYASDDSDERKMSAMVGERVVEAKYDLDNEYTNAKLSAEIALIFGTVFRKDYFDSTLGREAEIPVFDELGNEVVDPMTGEVQMNSRKTGDSAVAILTPLSISFDWSYTDFNRLPWIQESYLMPIEWIHESFGQEGPGFTGKALQVTDGGEVGNSLMVLEQMKYATPYSYGSSTRTNTKGKSLVIETYIEPNKSLPKGRLIIKAGGIDVYDSFNKGQDLGSPYFMPESPVMWHPYTMFQYAMYMGRMLGKSMVEGIIPQQMRLNEINGAILQNANTMAKADWLSPVNCLKRGIINGGGGNVFTFQPHPSGLKPEKLNGVALPTQFFKEKQDLIDQMVREVGTNFVMQGQAPTGVTASSAIEQLLENSTTQQSDLMNCWEKFHEQAYSKKLRVIRNFNDLPNQDIVDYLRNQNRDNLELEIKSFVGQDLGDGLSLKIEAGSTVPKSAKFSKDLYKELATEGLLGPVGEDSPRGARLRKELLSKFGEKGFDIDESADVEKANWENVRMLKSMPVEVWEEDNDEIHLSCHISKCKDPKFLERATDQVKQFYMDHIAAHKQSMAQKAAMQQQQMAAQAQAQQAHELNGKAMEQQISQAGASGESQAPTQ